MRYLVSECYRRTMVVACGLLLFLFISPQTILAQAITHQWIAKQGEWQQKPVLKPVQSNKQSTDNYYYIIKKPDVFNTAWDTLRTTFVIGVTDGIMAGFILNYQSGDSYHFGELVQSAGGLVFRLGQQQYGHRRFDESFTIKNRLETNKQYQLSIYRAPLIDKEHWRQWKLELCEEATKKIVAKESIENNFSFFGIGTVGLCSNSHSVTFNRFHVSPIRRYVVDKNLKPSGLFSNGMVLQRRKPIAVWGNAKAQASVTVQLGNNKGTTKADSEGVWKVLLPPMEAAKRLKMHIRSNNESLVFDDVAIGEVWVASGQSNMEMRAWQSDVADSMQLGQDLSDLRWFQQQQWPSALPQAEAAGIWRKGNSPDVMGWSAVALSFALHLNKTLQVPVGIIQSTWGGTGIESWMPRSTLEQLPAAANMLQRYKDYEDRLRNGQPIDAGWPLIWDAPGQSHAPAYLYNGMIYPLQQYTVQGVLWYQGESNCHRSSQYQYLLPAFLQSWRRGWQSDSLNFLIVQLAGYDGRQSGNQQEGAWPLLRDIQQKVTVNDKRTVMVTAFDLGDSLDIHPRKKWQLGTRLGYAALGETYHLPVATFAGPTPQKIAINGDKAYITYQRPTAEWDILPLTITGFEVAGKDRKFYPAQARLNKAAMEVSSPMVQQIEAVRYGWENYPVKANLKNREGMLALPFRSDDWVIPDQFSY